METKTRDDLLATIRRDRELFDAVLERIPADTLTEPILDGGWSVKDTLAHIAWGEREAIGVAQARALIGSPLWELDQDERNETVVRESRSRSLDDVMADYRRTFDDFVSAIEGLSDEELNDPTRFAGLAERIPGWLPWRVLYDAEHYEDHARALEEIAA